MKKMVFKTAVAFVILGSFCYSWGTPEELYLKAESLYNSIPDKTQSIKSIPRYKEITDLLEQITEKKQTASAELLEKTYYLMIDSYDKQARYPEKHNAMKEFAALKHPEDKEQQAQWLKRQADELMREGETAEAITLYRVLMDVYPVQKISLNSYFSLTEIFEQNGDTLTAAKTLLAMTKKYVQDEFSPKALLEAAKKFKVLGQYKESISCLETVIRQYPTDDQAEDALFALGFYYKEMKNNGKAVECWENYLTIYPNGQYLNIVKSQLKKVKEQK